MKKQLTRKQYRRRLRWANNHKAKVMDARDSAVRVIYAAALPERQKHPPVTRAKATPEMIETFKAKAAKRRERRNRVWLANSMRSASGLPF
jgi:hypothetical protein